MRPLRILRHYLEFAVFRSVVAVLGRMSTQSCKRFAGCIGSLAFAADNRRRDVACHNLRQTGLCPDERSIRKTARAANRNFCYVVMGALQAHCQQTTPPATRVVLDIAPETETILDDPDKGLILCSGHIGNWEIGVRALAERTPVVAIARPMNNPLVETFVQRRSSRNLTITPKHDADPGRLIRPLCEGKTLAILFDQHASNNRGIMVDFFGKPASTYPSPAMLHLITGMPICFGACVQTSEDAYVLRLDAPLQTVRTGNRPEDAHAIMLALNQRLEQAIRATPAQYLWSHRRWRDPHEPDVDGSSSS